MQYRQTVILTGVSDQHALFLGFCLDWSSTHHHPAPSHVRQRQERISVPGVGGLRGMMEPMLFHACRFDLFFEEDLGVGVEVRRDAPRHMRMNCGAQTSHNPPLERGKGESKKKV